MKISREQKEANRKALIQAGVDLMSKDGLNEVTLRRIAQAAGLSEPVIYKYFQSKDHLVAAYFTEVMKAALMRAESQKDFAELSFIAQVHLTIDAVLAELEPHRDFVREVFGSVFLSSFSGSLTYMAEEKTMFLSRTEHWLSAAIEAGEYAEPPSRSIVLELLWDFHLGLIYYWVKDKSESGMRTLQLLDQSLQLLHELLKSNLLGRIADLLFFLAREHFMKAIDKFTDLTDDQKAVKTRFFKGHGENKKGRKKPT